MQIKRLAWTPDRIEHVARHGITRAEVDEVCFGKPYVLRAKSEGENPVYYALGQTGQVASCFALLSDFQTAMDIP